MSLKRNNRTNRRILATIAFLLTTVFVFYGCGYTLKGQGSFLPEHIKKIALLEFQNQTGKYELEKVIFQKLQEELLDRGDFTIVSDETDADASLTGVISSYKTSPKSVNEEGRATSYAIKISISFKFMDLRNNKILSEDKEYTVSEDYQLTNLEDDFLDQEEFAIDEAATRLADALISTILEGF